MGKINGFYLGMSIAYYLFAIFAYGDRFYFGMGNLEIFDLIMPYFFALFGMVFMWRALNG